MPWKKKAKNNYCGFERKQLNKGFVLKIPSQPVPGREANVSFWPDFAVDFWIFCGTPSISLATTIVD